FAARQSLVGIMLRKPRLEPGESVEWRRVANRQQGGRAVGGQLTLTSRRLIFKAHRLDHMTRGEDWEADRADVVAVESADPSMENGVFSGGLRHRLAIRFASAPTELFVVWVPQR